VLETPTYRSPQRRLLTFGAAASGVLVVCASLAVVVAHDVRAEPLRLAVAIVVIVASLAARMPIAPGQDLPWLNWGVLGLMVACSLVPPAWVGPAVAVAAIMSHAPTLVGRGADGRAGGRYLVGVATVGAGAAALAVGGLAADPMRPVWATVGQASTLLILLVVALTSFTVTMLLAGAWMAADGDGPVGQTMQTFAIAGAPLVAASVFIGLAGAVVVAVSPWWLAVLVPMLWVLHPTFITRTRLNQEKRVWAELAEATRALHQMDDRGVRGAVVSGAERLFAPEQVELVVRQGRPYGDEPPRAVVFRSPEGPAIGGGTVKARRLVFGGEEIGQLRLRFKRKVRLSPAQQDAFLTFTDAVASALHDVSTHRRLQAMTALSAFEAVHDPLTGLSNRFTLLARGNAVLSRLDPDRLVALVLLDIDQFREINDAMSHAAGDEVLRLSARRLATVRADGELLGCLGGDEFALLITTVDGESPESAVTERVLTITAALATPAPIAGVTLATEVSAGVVTAAAAESDMTELLRRANLALRQARREGARVAVYDAHADLGGTDRLGLLADFRDALAAADQLVLYLQPRIHLHTGLPVGAEALVYWHHPQRGLIPPEEFVGTIEHSDMASGLNQYTVDLALAVAAEWSDSGLDVPISVNLCARSTRDPDVPGVVAGRLAAHAVPAERLIVEISEGVMAAEIGPVDQVITGLRAVGVQVSVDDFGTASASWAFLTRFAVDEVKIDRSFVAAMDRSPQARAIVRTTVDLARDLGLRVIAEGVERADQREALLAEGVDAGQGPLLAATRPAAEATAFMRRLISPTGRT
jgi:diguanylate cyclase (GGDEF)-like protein